MAQDMRSPTLDPAITSPDVKVVFECCDENGDAYLSTMSDSNALGISETFSGGFSSRNDSWELFTDYSIQSTGGEKVAVTPQLLKSASLIGKASRTLASSTTINSVLRTAQGSRQRNPQYSPYVNSALSVPHSNTVASSKPSSSPSLPLDSPIRIPDGKQLSHETSVSSLRFRRLYYKLTTSYQSRLAKFRLLFRNTPVDTGRLLVDYSCALSKNKNGLLLQGRMYVTENWVCFYSKILYEQKIFLSVKEIMSITKEKTARVIPNAIKILYSKAKERFFFTSFANRDRTFAILRRVWENCRNNETMSIEEIMQQVREIYGDDSFAMVYDEDVEDPDATHPLSAGTAEGSFSEGSDQLQSSAPNVTNSDKEIGTWSSTEEEHVSAEDDGDDDGEARDTDLNCCHSSRAPNPVRHPAPISSQSLQSYPLTLRDSCPRNASTDSATTENEEEIRSASQLSLLAERKNRLRKKHKKMNHTRRKPITDGHGTKLHKVVPSTNLFSTVRESDADSDLPATCLSDHDHPGQLYVDTEIALNIDALFNCLFTNSKFFRKLSVSRGTFDIEQASWPEINWPSSQADKQAVNSDGADETVNSVRVNTVERTISYTLMLKQVVGPRTCMAVEKQTLLLDESKPGRCYVVNAKVTNEAVPLCNCFHVVSTYCLLRTSRLSSRLRVTSQTVYEKPVFIGAKKIIEKTCRSGLFDFFSALSAKLTEFAANLSEDERLTGGWLSEIYTEDAATGANNTVRSIRNSNKTYGADGRILTEPKHSNTTARKHQAGNVDSNRNNKLSAAYARDARSRADRSISSTRSPLKNSSGKGQVSMIAELVTSPCKSLGCFFVRPDRAWLLLVFISLLLCLFLSMVYNRLVSLEQLAQHLSSSMPHAGGPLPHQSSIPHLHLPDSLGQHEQNSILSSDNTVSDRMKIMSNLAESMLRTVEQIQVTLQDVQNLIQLLHYSPVKAPPTEPLDSLADPTASSQLNSSPSD